jgi:hypothetical protein
MVYRIYENRTCDNCVKRVVTYGTAIVVENEDALNMCAPCLKKLDDVSYREYVKRGHIIPHDHSSTASSHSVSKKRKHADEEVMEAKDHMPFAKKKFKKPADSFEIDLCKKINKKIVSLNKKNKKTHKPSKKEEKEKDDEQQQAEAFKVLQVKKTKRKVLMEQKNKALDIAFQYGNMDGSHHRKWAIDQMVRALCGDEQTYNKWVDAYCEDEGDPDAYEWDEGIAP